ncbi:MAG: leucyl aminopeptidase family protein [Rubrivivax sp.]|jgi:leucyl aminopeptidase|nr:leucyl aminopeptidase family protein [Rubrivivax sp.]
MTVELTKGRRASRAIPIHCVTRDGFAAAAAKLDDAQRRWLDAVGFVGAADQHALMAGKDGGLVAVWAGVRSVNDPWALASLPKTLPPGTYKLGDAGLQLDDLAAAHAWSMGGYVFDAYKAATRAPASLQLADNAQSRRGVALAGAATAVRDLVNTPAEHMGPAELAEAVKLAGAAHGAKVSSIVGDALLAKGFPAVHAVGRAATRAPRLIELNWGSPSDPILALVGKGVCFDSGGLDIKPADGMRQMKKDMGGAAHALALAQLVMAAQLPVRLQLLIPAVENAIAGNAFRPGDVFKTRKGLHIEIGNTDAEGRVILCDALAYACESKPDLVVDLATLTGAARVALGPQLPALFTRDTAMARDLVDRGLDEGDPMWHMPLWAPYHGMIESDIADIVNTGSGPMGGAITAALFLADFVPETVPWLHLDLFAWNSSARPGRPVGGEAQTLRTLFSWLEQRYRKA